MDGALPRCHPRSRPLPELRLGQETRRPHQLAHLDEDSATFTVVCFDHGPYEAHIDPEDDQPYLDLAALYRNLAKERADGRDGDTLHVMKGGDWAFGSQLVDGALGALDTPPPHIPIPIFTPQVLAPTGAKLSKSLLREQGRDALPADVEPWMSRSASNWSIHPGPTGWPWFRRWARRH